jgi:hypothetical protein
MVQNLVQKMGTESASGSSNDLGKGRMSHMLIKS